MFIISDEKLKLDTAFYERYALISLLDLFEKRYAGLFNSDKPDLQDANKRYGIEVTRSMKENALEADEFDDEILGKFKIVNDVQAFEGTNSQLLQIIAQKSYILQHYKEFSEYGLYIFSSQDLTPSAVQDALKKTSRIQSAYKRRYTFMYINELPKIHICDLVNCTYYTIEIQKEKLIEWKRLTTESLEP